MQKNSLYLLFRNCVVAPLNEDYNKVIKLSLILLGKYPNDLKTPTIQSIGAISHARWMAKVICQLHMALFGLQLVKLR